LDDLRDCQARAAILKNQMGIDQSKSDPLTNPARHGGPGALPDQSPRMPHGLNLASRRLQQL
jgi:hypothetical protein